MLEPLGVAMHAVDLAHLRTGMSVGVFGCGPIGLLVLQMARLAGAAQVFVTEPLPHRLEAARKLGGLDWTPGQAVDVAFEVAGEDDAVETAFAAVKPGGTVMLAGIPADDRTSSGLGGPAERPDHQNGAPHEVHLPARHPPGRKRQGGCAFAGDTALSARTGPAGLHAGATARRVENHYYI